MVVKDKSYILIFITFSLLTFTFIAGLFLNSIDTNPIKLKIDLNNKVFTFVPQGWAFFTRNPREAQIVLYKKTNKNKLEVINQRHSSYLNLFGLNRKAAKMIIEVAFLKEKTNDHLFQNTRWNYQGNIYSKIPSKCYKIKNQLKDSYLKGEYVIVYQKPVPWAWSKSVNKIKMPAKIIRLNIE